MVKRAYVELRERVHYLKRLAFWTIRAEEAAGASELFHLTGSKPEDIDVVMTMGEFEVEKQQPAKILTSKAGCTVALARYVLRHYNQPQITTPFVTMERVTHVVRAGPC